MISQAEAQRIKSYVESLLIYETQVVMASIRLESAEEESVRELNEYVLKLSKKNAETTGENFISYLDSLTYY